jgi:CheY-like chemotaxis protein
MVEQVIMNLAVNARDAMPKGGNLAIATDPITFSASQARTHPESRPGHFVRLRVTDTGCGMDAITRGRIFEPFFTTKEVGKGTGLGLATVYGIIKQHDGWIEVESEPGKGATFSVFFPATSEPVQARSGDAKPDTDFTGGKETILIVEDESVLRQMAQAILQDCGYKTLEAASGREALKVWEEHRNAIDLVLTDVVMPEGISGMDLANKLLATKPRLKIVFASGYSMDDVNTAFFRQDHAGFLQKPYTHVTLARAVRNCLDKK